MLRLESRDITTLVLFALVAGTLGLATPLAVESLVNTVAWGTYLQPLFILSFILFGFLAFAGLLKLLQQIIVEVMQRRMFVRIVGDLAHRFPMARQSELESEHPSELANRYFDIMTIKRRRPVCCWMVYRSCCRLPSAGALGFLPSVPVGLRHCFAGTDDRGDLCTGQGWCEVGDCRIAHNMNWLIGCKTSFRFRRPSACMVARGTPSKRQSLDGSLLGSRQILPGAHRQSAFRFLVGSGFTRLA